jgi:sigma-E factor negative regulatory protein RseA
MNDMINEQISALVDGELPDAERELLQRRLAADGELKSTWQRYHLIRDALREDLPEFINKDMDSMHIEASDLPPVVVTIPVTRRFMKPLAGLAIAASVATMAVMGVLYNSDRLSSPRLPQVALAPAITAPVTDSFRVVPRSGWQSVKPAVVSHLNGYLVDHSGYAGFGSAQGIIPYSRVAGYDEPMPDEKLKDNENRESERQ